MEEDVIGNEAYAHYGFDICFNIVATEQNEETIVNELGRFLENAIKDWREQTKVNYPDVKIAKLTINDELLK